MPVLTIALTAFTGGVASAVLGWLDSHEPFHARKLTASVVRALFAGGIFALGYQFKDGVSNIDLIYAFLAGAGVDVLGNRIAGAIRNRGSE
jgi:hypothetical protein